MLIRKCDICGSVEQEGNGRYRSYTVPSCYYSYSSVNNMGESKIKKCYTDRSIDLCPSCESKIKSCIFKLKQGKGEVIDGND